MIKKDSRPIRRAAQSLRVTSDVVSRFLIPFRLLRSIHKMVHSRGFVVLSTQSLYFPLLEGYEGEGYRTTVEAVYIGKRKCKDAHLRRGLREAVIDSRRLVIEDVL